MMKIKWAKKQTGFTIVELLIVIVVIAILATISIVAYSSIQNRANDTAVQSDVRSLAEKVLQFHAINGEYPSGGSAAVFPGSITHAINKQSYAGDTSNLYYCVIPTGSNARFSIAAKSKSGKVIAFYDGGFNDYTGAYSVSTNICPATGIPTTETGYEYHYGYYGATSTWNGWTNG
jgi:prepilin-type N-terminal cleavage/methylation domain-containing protein